MSAPLVVVGDALLDVDVDGSSDRLCPDAPVPVVDEQARRTRPGGAGLAAMLAARDGAPVTLITGIGDDEAGWSLSGLLDGCVDVVTLPFRGNTVCKTRVRSGGEPVLRLDSGDGRALDAPVGEPARAALRGAGAVLVSDYGRGVTHNRALRQVLAALPQHVPLIWDPHPNGARPLARADLVLPNESEAAAFARALAPETAMLAAAGTAPNTARSSTTNTAGPSHGDTATVASTLHAHWRCGAVAITRGSRGAVMADVHGSTEIPVPDIPVPEIPVPEIALPDQRRSGRGVVGPDVCGAGDKFATVIAHALQRGVNNHGAVTAAVEAASRFVFDGGAGSLAVVGGQARPPWRTPGTSAFDLVERVRSRGGRTVATGGCFDLLHPGHVRLFERARALGDALVVCLNSDESVRRIKGPGRPVVGARDRARLLLALEPVDAVVVFDDSSPVGLLERLRPEIWVKGGDYTGVALPESDVVARYGGCVEIIPFEQGYSTTRLLTSLRTAG